MDAEEKDLREQYVHADYPTGDPDFVSIFRDDPLTFVEAASIREIAYRRGFIQGAAACCRAFEAGFCKDHVRDWITDIHIKWRCKRHRGKLERPKELT